MYSAEVQARVAILTAKAAEGSLSLEEMREAVKYLREERLAAANSSTTAKRAAAKASVKTAEDMLDEL